MKRQLIYSVSLMILGGLVLGSAAGALAAPELVGAAKCAPCHKAKTGDQWQIWSDSRHAQAFATLGSDQAKAIALEQGLGDPQQAAVCLKCHTTQAFLGSEVVVNAKGKYADTEGVGCESCHGPGSDYKSKQVMTDPEAAVAAGLIMDKSVAACTRCHNDQSPTFQGFDFEESWAQIAHPVPVEE